MVNFNDKTLFVKIYFYDGKRSEKWHFWLLASLSIKKKWNRFGHKPVLFALFCSWRVRILRTWWHEDCIKQRIYIVSRYVWMAVRVFYTRSNASSLYYKKNSWNYQILYFLLKKQSLFIIFFMFECSVVKI